jgi:hypothetical protein
VTSAAAHTIVARVRRVDAARQAVFVIDFCQASGAASQFMAARNHGEQRLTDILDDAIRQYRVIFDDRPH